MQVQVLPRAPFWDVNPSGFGDSRTLDVAVKNNGQIPPHHSLRSGLPLVSLGDRLGEAWQDGTVVLAWDAVRKGASDPGLGPNIVLHEFAHLLDFEDGRSDGAPLLDFGESRAARKSRYASWARVFGEEFERLRVKVQNGEEVVLNAYGATNPAEFFAVATETFFTCPHEMQKHHPELYDQLKGFYLQDPVQWTPVN